MSFRRTYSGDPDLTVGRRTGGEKNRLDSRFGPGTKDGTEGGRRTVINERSSVLGFGVPDSEICWSSPSVVIGETTSTDEIPAKGSTKRGRSRVRVLFVTSRLTRRNKRRADTPGVVDTVLSVRSP